MQKFVENLIRRTEKEDRDDPYDNMPEQTTTSESNKRNTDIFANLTFDLEGNPIQQLPLDPSRLIVA